MPPLLSRNFSFWYYYVSNNLGWVDLGSQVNSSNMPWWRNKSITTKPMDKCASHCTTVASVHENTLKEYCRLLYYAKITLQGSLPYAHCTVWKYKWCVQAETIEVVPHWWLEDRWHLKLLSLISKIICRTDLEHFFRSYFLPFSKISAGLATYE